MKETYIEKIYAGFLGKLIGIRYGAPIEGWTYEQIRDIYGELDDYIVDYRDFAADDDSNGPCFFIRALSDYTHTRDLTAEQIGLTWLNYTPYEHGFFWWGGYGVSTEHTAYLNLYHGIPAPISGSIAQNGEAVAEQIGGQIFIDSWGLVVPNNPALAAEYAEKAASVSHDGNGIYGGKFIAACISAAFEETDIEEVIDKGLQQIPEDSEYALMAQDVINFYREHPDDWEEAYRFVFNNYGYDRYPGICHIIPNSAVMILSMLYGQGDFSKTINICNMCGWDTDCNVANVGTILGVLNGLDGIEDKWRKPINDQIVCSSVIGSLNIVDIPNFVLYLSDLAYKIVGEELPEPYKDALDIAGRAYDFILPGSTHGFKIRSEGAASSLEYQMYNQKDDSAQFGNVLRVVGKPLQIGDSYRVYQRTYFKPEDLHDNRYDPAFSPIVYPGQKISASVKTDEHTKAVKARLYVRDRNQQKIYSGDYEWLSADYWTELGLTIPALSGACIDEVGVEVLAADNDNLVVDLLMEYFHIHGKADYTLDFSKETMECYTNTHREVSQCTYFKGYWDLTLNENRQLRGVSYDVAELYTGDYNWNDYEVETALTPVRGMGHCLNFRVQGAMRSYAVGLFEENQLILKKNNCGYETLIKKDFNWSHGETYRIKVRAVRGEISVYVNDEFMFKFIDEEPHLYGCAGLSLQQGGQCLYDYIKIKEL